MKTKKWVTTIFVTAVLSLCFINTGQADTLTEKSFIESHDSKGIVLISVNWGRQWRCGGFENAQLVNLSFDLLPYLNNDRNGKRRIFIETPSMLHVNDDFIDYGFIVEPREYAISGFKIKVAKSVNDVGFFELGPDKLIINGAPEGGSIKVNAGEIIYALHFALDCYETPIPWRYYPEGREAFKNYTAGVRK